MHANRTSRAALATWICVLATLPQAGCSMPKASDFRPSKMFSLDSHWPFKDKDAPEEGTPMRVVSTWTDTIMHQDGQKPQRGFGGRLVFYGKDEKKPIIVDGQLVVYAFDETGRELTDNKPTRRYVFPADQVPLHYSKSELGATYSFFLPWDEAGGPKTEVSLVCRFEPKKGAMISGEQTKLMLPGTMTLDSVAKREPPKLPDGVSSTPAKPTLEMLRQKMQQVQSANVQSANYEAPIGPGAAQQAINAASETVAPEAARQMNVTSIALPKNFQPQASALPINSAAATSARVAMNPTASNVPVTTTVSTLPVAKQQITTQQASPTAPSTYPQRRHRLGVQQLAHPQLMSAQTMSAQQPPTNQIPVQSFPVTSLQQMPTQMPGQQAPVQNVNGQYSTQPGMLP